MGAEWGFKTKSDIKTVWLTIGQHCFWSVGTAWHPLSLGLTRTRQQVDMGATIPTRIHLGDCKPGLRQEGFG